MTDLFGGALRPQPTPTRRAKPTGDTAPSREFAKPAGGTPREAHDALADIHHGRLGVLDNTDRIVRSPTTTRSAKHATTT